MFSKVWEGLEKFGRVLKRFKIKYKYKLFSHSLLVIIYLLRVGFKVRGVKGMKITIVFWSTGWWLTMKLQCCESGQFMPNEQCHHFESSTPCFYSLSHIVLHFLSQNLKTFLAPFITFWNLSIPFKHFQNLSKIKEKPL